MALNSAGYSIYSISRFDRPIVQNLMISLGMMVRKKFMYGFSGGLLSKQNRAIQEFLIETSNIALDVVARSNSNTK
jgi:hypothetical protein